MKVLYLADIRFPMERANGIQTVETAHALARRGVKVELVVRRSDDRSDEEALAFFGLELHPGLRVRRLPVYAPGTALGRLSFFFHAAWLLWREARRYDALYTRDLMLADLGSRLAPRLPVVYEAHTVAAVFAEERARMYEAESSPSARKLARLDAREKRVLRNASGVVAITRPLVEALGERHGVIARSRVIPDGCRAGEAPPPPPESGNRPAAYYIGQLYPWKGVDVLVEAMQHLDGVDLVIVGGLPPEPDLARIQSLAEKLGLSNRVRFRGFVPPAELDRERRKASLFVIPLLDTTTARLFTSPLKLFEAMAANRPIVASDLRSIGEVLTHEVNALLVPPGDPRALAQAIERLAEDGNLARRLAARAVEDVQAYTWDRRAEAIEAFLKAR